MKRRRDKLGRFLPNKKHAKKHGAKHHSKPKRNSKRIRRSNVRRTRQRKIASFKPVFNLCFAADREDFFQEVSSDKRKYQGKLKGDQAEGIRLVIDVIGTPKRRYRKEPDKKGRKTWKPKTTAFIGKRKFHDFRKLKRFLLLTSGYSGDKSNPLTPDWSKEGMCQYEKTAELIVQPIRPGMKPKVLKRYKLES